MKHLALLQGKSLSLIMLGPRIGSGKKTIVLGGSDSVVQYQNPFSSIVGKTKLDNPKTLALSPT